MTVTIEAADLQPGDVEDGLTIGRVWEKNHHVMICYANGRFRLKYKHSRVTVERPE